MAPTIIQHPFQSAVTHESGATTIRFEGVKPQRTQKAYPFLVGYVSTYPWKYDPKVGEQVPSDEKKFVIVKGTRKFEVARKAQQECRGQSHAEPAVILRMVAGGYEVMS